MKIMHLSDLHICHESLQGKLSSLKTALKGVSDRYGGLIGEKLATITDLDLVCAERTNLIAIGMAVHEIDPDVICITGDITTFGDKKSFQQAVDFIAGLQRRMPHDRMVVVTPGNHDVLCSQLAFLKNYLDEKLSSVLSRLPWLAKVYVNRKVKSMCSDTGLHQAIDDLLKDRDVLPHPEDPLYNYTSFVADSQCNVQQRVGSVRNSAVMCVPFNTVSLDPLWVNIGDGRKEEFIKFRTALQALHKEKDTLVIALVHHNPVSTPDIVESHIAHAYNSFPGASQYVKEMQDVGVDIVLYGHQHESSCCQVDFIPSLPGHLYLMGAPSATDSSMAGFNVIDIEDRFCGVFQKYRFKRGTLNFDKVGNSEPVVFEDERVRDSLTMSVRHEIRHLVSIEYDINKAEREQGFESNVQDILIVRPRGSEFADDQEAVFRNIRAILKSKTNDRVRVLLADPNLFATVTQLEDDGSRERLSQMWGDRFSWENQASTATHALSNLIKFRDSLVPTLRPKLEVGLAHTLMPIGAIMRKNDGNRELVFLRILPVGVDALDRPVLKIEKRHLNGISEFYCKYLEELWNKSKKV